MALACVVCVMQKLNHFLHPSLSKFLFPISDIESIQHELSFLADALRENIYKEKGSKLREDPLEQKIEDAVDKFDDLLESHRVFSESTSSKDEITDYSLLFSQQLLQFKQQISSLTEKVKDTELSNSQEVHEGPAGEVFTAHNGAVSSMPGLSGEDCSKLVGLEDELRELVEGIVRSRYEVLSIVGMAGIGKTTLARQIYDHPVILSHFDTRIFVTLGPNCKLREFLILVLGHIGVDVVERRDGNGGVLKASVAHFRILHFLKEFKLVLLKKKFRPPWTKILNSSLIKRLQQLGNDELKMHLLVERLQQLGNDELKMHLRSYLKNQRYLLVMDNVWDEELVDELNLFLLPVKNRSRIILTTRLYGVAGKYATGHIHRKQFMNDDDGWDLLYRIIFTTSEECCSKELEEIGKKIIENCEGLPLVIVAIGELLSKNKTKKYWEKVLEDENPLKIGEDKYNSISRSIYPSYEMLPRLLKPCFLYVGVFPKIFQLQTSRVNALWKAEGFLKPWEGISLDEMGAALWIALYQSSLVLQVYSAKTGRRIRIARVHYVFRNLCIAEAPRENFCHVIKRYGYNFRQGIDGQPRWCIHNNVVFGIKDVRDAMLASLSPRSLLCLGAYHAYPLQVPLSFPLLKILHASQIRFFKFPREVLVLVRLKYLEITCDELPQSISKLWNLEFLIVMRHYKIYSVDDPAHLPLQIWDLKWLIELRCYGFDLLDPCTDAEGCVNEYRILEYLQTLSGVSSHSCTQGILARIPNLTKLLLLTAVAPGKVETLSFLGDVAHQLHSLRSFHFSIGNPNSQVLPTMPVFPCNIKKLTLHGCRFLWEYMSVISCLPSLEFLKLYFCAFHGRVWACETEFLKLKVLWLTDLDIEEWIANYVSNPFPKLIYCAITHCYKLRKLPMNLGNIETLEWIRVHDCNPLVNTWAKQIQQNHLLKYPNAAFEVNIHSSWEDE